MGAEKPGNERKMERRWEGGEKTGIMGLNQRIIFTSHPKRRKRGASHFRHEFPSQNVEKAGEKAKEERKGSVGIAPALPGIAPALPANTAGFSRAETTAKRRSSGKPQARSRHGRSHSEQISGTRR